MSIPRVEVLLLNLKLLTVLGAGALAVLSMRSARRRADRSITTLAAGLVAICVGAGLAFLGGFLFGATPILWVIESALLVIGVGLLLLAIYID